MFLFFLRAAVNKNGRGLTDQTSAGTVLAPTARFERATFRLGGGRSILLSYVGV